MSVLADANVLSEQTKPQPNKRVVDWVFRNDASLVLNPIILGELELGILTMPNGRRRTTLLEWYSAGVKLLPVLPMDTETAAVWAKLLAELRRKGRTMPVKDSLIAATARQHNLAIATRNTDDYQHAGVKLINPFQD